VEVFPCLNRHYWHFVVRSNLSRSAHESSELRTHLSKIGRRIDPDRGRNRLRFAFTNRVNGRAWPRAEARRRLSCFQTPSSHYTVGLPVRFPMFYARRAIRPAPETRTVPVLSHTWTFHRRWFFSGRSFSNRSGAVIRRLMRPLAVTNPN
jgi:hypothetical protein